MKSLLLSEYDPPPHNAAGRVIVLAFTKGSLLWSNTASLCWCSYVFIVIVFQCARPTNAFVSLNRHHSSNS